MARYNRRSAPEVRGGKVQRKNNLRLSPSDYYSVPRNMPVIDRRRPGPGYRHLLRPRDIVRFIGILPEWDELSLGLHAIVLAPGEFNTLGYHTPGVVEICAWDADLWIWMTPEGYEQDREVIGRLGVPCERRSGGVLCKWTVPTARAFQLLVVFLHELGHHHDRMTTKSKRWAARGEPYAEAYARQHGDLIWDSYLRDFRLE